MAVKNEEPQHLSITINGVSYTKHSRHWYPDGNVVFTAQKSAFRLFKSFLIRRSAVMAFMLADPPLIPPPDDESNAPKERIMFEGVHVVQMHDPAFDVALLFDTILPQPGIVSPISSETPSMRLLGLAEIAQKYQMNDVVSQTIEHLAKVLPTTDAWRSPPNSLSPAEAIRVIDWAHRCKFGQFLPMAFYILATTQWDSANISLGAINLLQPQDQFRIQHGRVQLQTDILKFALSRWENNCRGSSKPEKGCPNRSLLCWTGYEGKAWASSADVERWTNLLLHPLEELAIRAHNRKLVPLNSICRACHEQFVRANSRMARELVDNMDKIFGLRGEVSEECGGGRS
ncbi:hypothetical protein FRB90_010612 [Tulasnella sp. 427]|nr:hypothetical protein FRB90_010612 [Tulasnella sp. 427]